MFRLAVGSLLAAIGIVTLAHTGATGVVKERMDAMEDMSDKSKRISAMFKDGLDVDNQFIQEAARNFILHGEKMLSLFPDTEESRTGSQTGALPVVWENWGEFTKLNLEFIERSKKLSDVALSSDRKKDVRKAFLNVARSCKTCHKKFREKE